MIFLKNLLYLFKTLINVSLFLLIFLPYSLNANVVKKNKQFYQAQLIFGKFVEDKNYLIAGIKINLEDNWKIYWKNPGEAGIPPNITWDKTSNISNIDFLFPEPKSFKFFNIDTFGYDKEIIFPLKIYFKNSEHLISSNIKFNAQICNSICIPIEENFRINYFLENKPMVTSFFDINNYLKKVPQLYSTKSRFFKKIEIDGNHLYFYFENPVSNFRIIIENKDNLIFSDSYIKFKNFKDNFVKIKIPPDLKKDFKNDQLKISFFSNENKFFYNFSVDDFWINKKNYMYLISIALLAGFILNFMPCVLPVLSLKIANIMSLINTQNSNFKKRIINQILGIISSFLILFFIISFFRNLGGSITWGFQFQYDYFLIIISFVIIFFSLNLFGFFEVKLPFKLNQILYRLNYKKYEDFLSGCLLTLLATPCTAPFVGTAVIFALSGSYFESFLIFFFMSIGMSIPLFLVILNPSIFNFFPKSGKWFIYFKRSMASIFMLSGLWFLSIFVNNNFNNILSLNNDKEIRWINWNLEKEPNLIKDLVSKNKTVFLDITADWCITCQYNKLTVLNDKRIKEIFKQDDFVLLQLNWTQKNENIKKFLISKNRYGIPFNEIYNYNYKEGFVLPELLDKSQLISLLNY